MSPAPIASSPLIDAVPALPSLRSLGTAANQAISGPLTFGQVEFVSGTYTLAATDRYIQIQTHGVTVNLLATAGYLDNECIVIQDKTGSLSGFPVTVVPNGSDHIDGAGSALSFNVDSGVLVLRKTATGWWSQITGSSLTLTIPEYATSSLPAPDGSARIAKLTDGVKGFVFSNGSTWRSTSDLNVFVMEDFGAIADGTTDCLTAWNAIMAAIPSTSGGGTQAGTNGAIIRFANGAGNVYHFSDTPQLSVPCILQGSGGVYGAPRTLVTTTAGKKIFEIVRTGSNSEIRDMGFSANDAGGNVNVSGWQGTHAYSLGALIVPAYAHAIKDTWTGYIFKCTTAGTSGGSQPSWPVCNTNATRTETEGQTITDGSAVWTAIQAHGVVVNGGNCRFENVQVNSCAGDGFHCYGDGMTTDASQTRFVRCASYENYSDGFYAAGPNANVCQWEDCSGVVNGGYGFTEQSQLGSALRSCHTRSNGQIPWVKNGGPYVSGIYMGPTQENGYLYLITIGGTNGSTEPTWPTTVGVTVTSGSVTYTCMRAYNGGAYNPRGTRLDACYAESDQQPIALGVTSFWSSGANGPGFANDFSASGGFFINSRGQMNSHAAISDAGDGFPITSWLGSKDGIKRGLSLEVNDTAGSVQVSGSELSLVWSTGGSSANGWRTRIGSADNLVIADGTEPGTAAGDIEMPHGFWVGAPNGASGGSFQSNQGSISDPGGGQVGDEVIHTGNSVGPARWHNMGTAGWIPYGQAGAGPRRDVTNGSGSPYPMVAADHNRVITNQGGTSAKTYITLPDNSAAGYGSGQFFRAIIMVQDSHGIRVKPQNPQTITVPGVFTTVPPNDFIESTQVGATVVLTSVNGVEWYCESLEGRWVNSAGFGIGTPQESFCLEDFGGSGDGSTDNLAAWNAIQVAMVRQTDSTNVGARITFANAAGNVYYFSQTPQVFWSCTIEGNGGAFGRPRTQLKIAQGFLGLHVLPYNMGVSDGTGTIVRNLGIIGLDNPNEWAANTAYTTGTWVQPIGSNFNWGWTGYLWKCTTPGTSGGSQPTFSQCNTDATRVEDFGAGPTVSDNGVVWTGYQVHGVYVEAPFCKFEDVYVEAFPMDGFHFNGTGFTQPSTDLTFVSRCHAVNCHGDGLYGAGENSNISKYEAFDAIANFGYGVNDQGFLANTHDSHHTRNNGYQPFAATNGYLVGDVTGPQLVNGYLYVVTIAGTSGTEPTWPLIIGNTVTSGGVTFKCARAFSGGPYNMRGNVCTNLYQEGGQPYATIGAVSMVFGGSVDNGPDAGANDGWMVHSRANVGSFATVSNSDGVGGGVQTWVGAKTALDYALSFAKLSTGSPISNTAVDLVYHTGASTQNGWYFQLSSGAQKPLLFCDGTETGTTVGQMMFPQGFWIAGPNGGAGGSFQFIDPTQTGPTSGGQLGDEMIRIAQGGGPPRWHHIGTDGWVPAGEAGGGVRTAHTEGVGAPYQILAKDHNRLISNEGASAKVYLSLINIGASTYATSSFFRTIVACQNANGIRVTAQGGHTITVNGVVSMAGGYVESTTIGSMITLVSINGTEWYPESITGAWSLT